MNSLLKYFKNEKEFVRLKELNKYFKKNEVLYAKISEMTTLQKSIVKYRFIDDKITYDLNKKYNKLLEDIIDIPFVEEYFELLNLFYNSLEIVKKEFENSLI